MSLPVIEMRGLGKSYPLKGQPFWALRGIDLDVERGEVLGIVGRNGAGKTTLLRVLSRITAPTEGWARLRGKVGTLLETGTGFHENLTGRENVRLNGTILGMPPEEIRRRFDEIVEFSGVGPFIDQQVKHYSSGMKSRLAFSVAAHLDTEILLVDEVLAVGDLAFREKCLKKMDEVAHDQERTVLFVSHSMGAVLSMCTRALLIEGGQLAQVGPTAQIVQSYRDLMLGPSASADLRRAEGRKGTGALRLVGFGVQDAEGRPLREVPAGSSARLVFDYENHLPRQPGEVVMTAVLCGAKGARLFGLSSAAVRADLLGLGSSGRFVCTLPKLPLLPGIYDVVASCLVDNQLVDKLVNVCSIVVGESDYFGTGRLPPNTLGEVLVDFDWTHEA